MEPIVAGMTYVPEAKAYVHKDQLFQGGTRQRVVKSHCCLCHRRIGGGNAGGPRRKETLGNCCVQCNHRTSLVGRYLIGQAESDLMLAMITEEPETELWAIDDVPYWKHPDGRLEPAETLTSEEA